MANAAIGDEKLIEFLYAAPVGLVEINALGTIALINPYAMKHLLPLAGARDTGNLFSMLDHVAPELRNMFESFTAQSGTVCDGHRIMVDLCRHHVGTDPKMLACTLVKLDANRAIACISDITIQVAQERRLSKPKPGFHSSTTSTIMPFYRLPRTAWSMQSMHHGPARPGLRVTP